MATARKLEELEIWKLSREFCKLVYPITCREEFLKDYRFRNQLNDSSGSIMDNIAEGFERGGNNELVQFLSIARGSCGESRSQIYRAFDRGYLYQDELTQLVTLNEEISNKTGSFMNYLNNSPLRGIKFKDRR
ncbi:MAG: four helix bundle protein [Chitinophagaceae bacterium]|nr:four helix bundle protein [Chitinophagaceae bacterium]